MVLRQQKSLMSSNLLMSVTMALIYVDVCEMSFSLKFYFIIRLENRRCSSTKYKLNFIRQKMNFRLTMGYAHQTLLSLMMGDLMVKVMVRRI